MQKSLTYSKGMTTSPSDLLSDDTELAEAVGMVFRQGEMHPIQKGVTVGRVQGKIMYVHRGANFETVVSYETEGNVVHLYGRNAAGEITGDATVSVGGAVNSASSVGNTLILSTDNGPFYLLLKSNKYITLGSSLPKPSITFSTTHSGTTRSLLDKETQACDLKEIANGESVFAAYDSDGNYSGEFPIGTGNTTKMTRFWIKDGRTDDFQTAVAGHIALVQNLVKEKNQFLYPFFVRYALRLFDGSYARISAPVAVYPSISRNGYVTPVTWKDRTFKEDPASDYKFLYLANVFTLSCKISVPGLDEWSDIVKDVVVFATDDVMPWQIDSDYQFVIPADSNGYQYLNYVASRYTGTSGSDRGDITTSIKYGMDSFPARYTIMPKSFKSEQQIIDDMLTRAQFYKLFSISNSDIKQGVLIEAPIKKDVVTNLMQQEQLPNDDYYGWTTLVSNGMYAYNKRINLFRAKRMPFKGFNSFTAYGPKHPSSGVYQYFVHIVSDTMDAWVRSDTSSEITDVLDSWFYYPDTNATEAIIWDTGNSRGQRITLKRHTMLNGVYSFDHLPLYDNFLPGVSVIPTVDATACEDLSSQIFTSVVNNPFVFEASGDNTVGTGSIVGIAANTEPVSQGQFGQYPLIVFTTEGIYGMAVSDEGLYSSSYPISREVCSNASSITPTGRLVFFTSKKGLMAVSGGTVTCMSGQLQGRNPLQFVSVGDGNFLKFLDNALLAYDYRDSLLHVMSTEAEYEYVYSISDGTFGKATLSGKPVAVANAYPDNLIQMEDGSMVSLMAKPDINEDTTRYSGTFVTRPLKLGSSLQLKTIHRIVHLTDSVEGSLELRLYGSNDCRNWCELGSLHGKPWKYYRLAYSLENLLAADSFAGSVVDFQTVLPDKIR